MAAFALCSGKTSRDNHKTVRASMVIPSASRLPHPIKRELALSLKPQVAATAAVLKQSDALTASEDDGPILEWFRARLLSATAIRLVAVVSGAAKVPDARIAGVALTVQGDKAPRRNDPSA
jgi:hypothetical protein